MPYQNILEEELKNKIAQDYFSSYDCTKIIGKVDFCVLPKKTRNQTELFKEQSLLWAEAKASKRDIITMFAQLILTIGKARTFDKNLPPAFLGVLDSEKIAFVSYDKIHHLFYKSDFNWNVTPSNHNTKEFSEIKSLINNVLDREKYLYFFGKDDNELKFFIKNNLAKATEQKIQIDKNNFVPIYLRWLDTIKPLINVDFTEIKSKYNILDSDFYLADLFVDDNADDLTEQTSVKESLFVTFYVSKPKGEYKGYYEIIKENLNKSLFKDTSADKTFKLNDITKYTNFWKRYKRPPIKEFQDYIIKRRDLLVPQDVRERKGAFFTPKQWVELSQKYIADVLGENWQEEYYIWDCAAGTGNLLAGLTNKYNIWASTLDQADVNVMHERINNGANLLKSHVFQFDFLNDDFFNKYRIIKSKKYLDKIIIDDGKQEISSDKTKVTINNKTYELELTEKSKLPLSLQEIIKNPEKRKKLVVYINPPYAEAGNARTFAGTGENKAKISTNNKTYYKYKKEIGRASNELFAQFLIRIYYEIPTCKIANFSKLKNLQSSNFSDFRKEFRAKLEKIFLAPANTFDNVKGQFPIGFFIWNGGKKELFKEIIADIYESDGNFIEQKKIINYDGLKYISDWLAYYSKEIKTEPIGNLASVGNDFQHQRMVFIDNVEAKRVAGGRHTLIYVKNLVVVSIYFSVRHCIEATWLNDRDQFLYPKDSWQNDTEFHNNCLIFTLFNTNIKNKFGKNNWIPFTQSEVDAKESFKSHFMSDFLSGKIKPEKTKDNESLFVEELQEWQKPQKRIFSTEATEVFDAGRELWKYYHSKNCVNPDTHIEFNINASLYDIREYFQGRNEKGKMNNKSTDEKYTELIGTLREKLKILAEKIAVKVYEHGFLKT